MTSRSSDTIHIRGLEIWCRIGVPEDERSAPQRLLLDAEIIPATPFSAMEDAIERTVDYAAVCQRLNDLAACQSCHLIETLAAEAASLILEEFKATEVAIEIRKFILPNTEHMSARCVKSR